jgi:hypothetical protein
MIAEANSAEGMFLLRLSEKWFLKDPFVPRERGMLIDLFFSVSPVGNQVAVSSSAC